MTILYMDTVYTDNTMKYQSERSVCNFCNFPSRQFKICLNYFVFEAKVIFFLLSHSGCFSFL